MNKLIDELKVKERIILSEPIYNLKEKIRKIDAAKIFILPSKREAMPQALIEAMARGKIVLSSRTEGAKEIIRHKQNGFLFEIENEEQLSELINKLQDMPQKQKNEIEAQTKKYAKQFSWGKLIKKLNYLYEKRT